MESISRKEYKRAWWKRYRTENREKVLAKKREYHRAHLQSERARHIQWSKNNPEKRRSYYSKKIESDLNYKLAERLRTRFKHSISKINKTDSAVGLVGCSVESLRTHLESLFLPGMTWENYGYRGWHIDHIRPLASFDLTDPEQQREAFHYTNLQPLWARDNLVKGTRYPHPLQKS